LSSFVWNTTFAPQQLICFAQGMMMSTGGNRGFGVEQFFQGTGNNNNQQQQQ
jgi:hypothetical protein